MRIFFACGSKKVEDYKKYYNAGLDVVSKSGGTISNIRWLRGVLNSSKVRKTKNSFQKLMTSLLKSDAVIIDASVQTITLGFFLRESLNYSKPTLIIKKSGSADLSEIFTEQNDKAVIYKEYDDQKELEKIVREFLDRCSNFGKSRFNLVLNPNQDKYIKWASYTYGKTKTDVIHDAINKVMDSDVGYGGK